MHSAGIVADHAAQRAAVVRGRIGREGQVMLLRCVAEVIENHSGLHPGNAAGGVDLPDLRHVLGGVEKDGGGGALPGEGRSSTTGRDGRAGFTTSCAGEDYIYAG